MNEFKLKEYQGFSYFIATNLEEYGIPHLFSTKLDINRQKPNGVNFGFSNSTPVEDTLENYRLAAEILGADLNQIIKSTQTHGDQVVFVGPQQKGMGVTRPTTITDADGLVTNHKDIPLCIFIADCVPILIGDKKHRVCCGVHAGWRGTEKRILEKAVNLLTKEEGIPLSDLVFAIGPCIGSCCFEISLPVAKALQIAIPSGTSLITQIGEETFYGDLSGLNHQILLDCGVKEKQISKSGLCTKCDPRLFHSYRREQESAGRMAAFITTGEE